MAEDRGAKDLPQPGQNESSKSSGVTRRTAGVSALAAGFAGLLLGGGIGRSVGRAEREGLHTGSTYLSMIHSLLRRTEEAQELMNRLPKPTFVRALDFLKSEDEIVATQLGYHGTLNLNEAFLFRSAPVLTFDFSDLKSTNGDTETSTSTKPATDDNMNKLLKGVPEIQGEVRPFQSYGQINNKYSDEYGVLGISIPTSNLPKDYFVFSYSHNPKRKEWQRQFSEASGFEVVGPQPSTERQALINFEIKNPQKSEPDADKVLFIIVNSSGVAIQQKIVDQPHRAGFSTDLDSTPSPIPNPPTAPAKTEGSERV